MKVVTFGELLVRLNPDGYYRLKQARDFLVSYTGAEANVAVALANWKVDSSFVTKLPQNDISEAACMQLKKFGVDLSKVIYGGDRIGVYYLEKGASQRPSKIVYDRKFSSMSLAKSADFDWNKILLGADLLHITGITPAIGEGMPQICIDACREAKKKGILVSLDLNFRSNLWDEAKAQKVMTELANYADVIIGNEEDAEKTLGVKVKNTDVDKGILDKKSYIDSGKQVAKKYKCKAVAYSLRKSISASRNLWRGMLYTDDNAFFSKEYDMQIVDRVGGGDSYAAGIIYGLLTNMSPEETVEYATAASCLKHATEQDFSMSTTKEVYDLMKGNGSGRIQR